MTDERAIRWTTCARVFDVATAQVMRATLQAEGIPCVVPDENMASVAWHLGQAIGGVRVQVPHDELERARAILEVDEPAGESSSAEDRDASAAPSAEDDLRRGSGEELATRAFRASVLGLVLFFLLPYSFLLSLQALARRDLAPRARVQGLLAFGISLLAMVALGVTYGLLR